MGNLIYLLPRGTPLVAEYGKRIMRFNPDTDVILYRRVRPNIRDLFGLNMFAYYRDGMLRATRWGNKEMWTRRRVERMGLHRYHLFPRFI